MPAERPSVASKRRAPKARARGKPVLRFRMRITDGSFIAVGPGKITLLEEIDRTGSLTAAAKSLEMSYRRAWILLDEVNRALRQPAVDSAKGATRGRQHIDRYRPSTHPAVSPHRAAGDNRVS